MFSVLAFIVFLWMLRITVKEILGHWLVSKVIMWNEIMVMKPLRSFII